MINYHKPKYFPFYWSIVKAAELQSVSNRDRIGAVMVLPNGMIATGWNGTPSGTDNCCESSELELNTRTGLMEPKTKPEVVHAERNVLKKLLKAGLSSEGAILFISREPCPECVSILTDIGIKEIHYMRSSPKNAAETLTRNSIQLFSYPQLAE
jgi:dCMP deaminase